MKLDAFKSLLSDIKLLHAPRGLQQFPADELRFVIEYREPPDFQNESSRMLGMFPASSATVQPLSPHRSLGRFLVLRFPDLGRVLARQSQFELAYEIRDTLDVVSVEPDLGSDFYADPESTGNEITEAALVGSLCEVQTAPPPEVLWAVQNIKAAQAWELSRGEGVLIGHPDTGMTNHVELADMFDLSKAIDLIDADAIALDPLHAGMANPGHGTATASVIASRAQGTISGIAPGAKVVPIRCIEDVKVFNQAPVAAAVAHAQSVGCNVISMSLGGVPSRALHAAIRAAIDAGIIVLAAAGNCVRIVVWPARYDEVIAVAGSNINDAPWRGSSRGDAVDISAPGEHVWCAKRATESDPLDAIKAGQGTSFAVASVAGAAALWLGAHSHAAVQAMAAQRSTTVQALFKAALAQTARRPPDWDTDRFGPGILDALALVRLPLNEINVGVSLESATDTYQSVRGLLADEHGPLGSKGNFQWERYGCELGTIALQLASEGASISELSRESKSSLTLPSRQLAEAVDRSNEPSLLKFGVNRGKNVTVFRPSAPRPVPPDFVRLRHALSLTPETGLESSADNFNPVKACEYLLRGGVAQQVQKFEAKLANIDSISPELRHFATAAAEEALTLSASSRNLGSTAQFGLEALVALTGRPALRTKEDGVNLEDPRAAEWHDQLYLARARGINKVIQSVGRIDLDGRHIGTGFVVAPGLILTNRHVLQDIATPIPTQKSPRSWVFDMGEPTICFDDQPIFGNDALRFRIKGVLAWGPSPIGNELDPTALDAVLLEVETNNASGNSLPAALSLRHSTNSPAKFDQIVTIGYPAKLSRLPKLAGNVIDVEVLDRLEELYKEYGVRYLAPGEVTTAQSAQPGTRHFWMMSHDATTLGGCSGSCLVSLDHTLGTVGLHFGGVWRSENFGHSLAVIKASSSFFGQATAINWIP